MAQPQPQFQIPSPSNSFWVPEFTKVISPSSLARYSVFAFVGSIRISTTLSFADSDSACSKVQMERSLKFFSSITPSPKSFLSTYYSGKIKYLQFPQAYYSWLNNYLFFSSHETMMAPYRA
ncbi:hypothetical protein L6164_028501 [Bauhinia variegata]|uniref:Uncharacterized protein n=1 Tax=Bauhinia variegata TaxID=167791 RepID=A0ACB9L6E0_BAUVA|nr:hypothetical protein L6164_028501 [Bauhinia variegata]